MQFTSLDSILTASGYCKNPISLAHIQGENNSTSRICERGKQGRILIAFHENKVISLFAENNTV